MIKTKQIIEQLELYLGKLIEEISIEDLNDIDELTINNFDITKNKQEFYIEDLLLFKNLKSITFNNMIIDIDIINYIGNSNIEELNLYNCELLVELTSNFDKITNLKIEYVDKFKEEYLNYFPNIEYLSYKGYELKNKLPKKIKVLDIMNSTIKNDEIFFGTNINEIFISKKEYDTNKDFYSKLIIKVNVYDENNCYLLNSGDKHE